MLRFAVEPLMRYAVVLVIWPGKRQQNVGVEQRGLHVASSASSFLARLLGMMGASAAT